MTNDRKAIFYSVDGRVFYWGRYSAQDIAQMKRNGLHVMADTKRNRMKLS